MRVAIVSSPYVAVPPVKYGGTELVVYHLINGLKELGHEPVLFGPGDSKVDCEIIPICEKATGFGLTEEERSKVLLENDIIDKRTKNLLRKNLHKFDIIHSHGFDLIDFQDVPNLTTIHGPFDFANLDYFEKRKHLYFVSVSKNQQDSFPNLQYAGVAYNGLNPETFPLITEPEDYLCFLGRLDAEKKPDLAIELALKLNMKLKIGGKIDFKGRDYFEKEIKPHLDNPLIEFLGELNFQQKIDLVSKAKCNFHPTGFREPFGLSVLESAYCGTPTIAISRGSMMELIENGRTGILVEDFVEAYHRFSEVLQLDRNYIAQRSRSLFNYKSMSKQYLFAYEKVIEVFNTKKNLDDVVKNLLENAKTQLADIWRGQI